MATSPLLRVPFPARLALALLAGALWYAAQGLHPLWWAAWLAPVPVLVAASAAGPAEAFGLGALAGLAGAVSLVPYYWSVAGVPVAVIVPVARAAASGLTVLLAAAAARRWAAWQAVLVYPVALAGLDFLATAGSVHGTAGSLAYTQMDFVPALQVASLGGTSAVVFLLGLGAASVALLLVRARAALGGGLLGLAVVAGALGWGVWRESAPPGRGLPVALLATDRFEGIPRAWDQVAAAYEPGLRAALAAGAQIVVLPEKIVALGGVDLARAGQELGARAKAGGVTIVAGVLAAEGGTRWNRALVALPDGALLTYDKRHLVPGWEASQTPGHADLMLPASVGPVGVAICKDMDFPALGRFYARLGARVMLAPAWDFAGPWGEDGWLHGRMAVLRGVEGGFSIARAARQGRLTVSDRFGRVLAEAPSRDGMGTLVSVVPLPAEAGTLYSRVGDVFGAGCAALTACAAGLLLWRRRA